MRLLGWEIVVRRYVDPEERRLAANHAWKARFYHQQELARLRRAAHRRAFQTEVEAMVVEAKRLAG